MKKVFALTLMLLMIASFSVCQASISPDRMNAGGIFLGQSLSEVVSIYGKPVSTQRIESLHKEFRYLYGRYGTTFDVTFNGKTAGREFVIAIRVAGNNGIATSDGIKVGTPVSEVKRILGKPDKENAGSLVYSENKKDWILKMMRFDIKNNAVVSYSVWFTDD